MAIVFKYGSPGPILAAGYAAGAGHQMHEQQDDALKVWQQNSQRDFQANQSWLDRLQQTNLQQGYFNQQNQQATAQRAFQAEYQNNALGAQSTLAGRQRDFQAEQTDKQLAARAGESELDRQQRAQLAQDAQLHADLRSGDMVLPPAVGAKINKLDSDLAELTALAPAGKDEFMQEYAKRRQELTRMAVPRSAQTDSERLAEARKTLPPEHQGLPLVIDDNNKLSVLPGWKPDTSAADAQKQRETDLKKYLGDELAKVNPKTGEPEHSNPDSAMTAAVSRYDAFQRGLKGEKPPEPQMSAENQAYQADFMRRIADDQRRIAAQQASPEAAAQPAPQVAGPPQFASPPVTSPPPVPARPSQVPPQPQVAPQGPNSATRPQTQFDLGNLPSNMTQVHPNQRQMFAENMPQHINELPIDVRQKYTSSWPHPATPEAAAKMSPGTVYITPEGRIKAVPF